MLASVLGAGALTGAACRREALGPSDPLPLHVFTYDRGAPLDAREAVVDATGAVIVRSLDFASPGGGRATGLLFATSAAGPRPAIILVHGMSGDAASMSSHARSLAERGAIALSLDAPIARRGGLRLRLDASDSVLQVQLVHELQRAVDYLLSRGDVDPARIGYLGYSYGGAMGALFAGVERRVRAYALLVADGGLLTHFTGPDDRASGPLTQVSPEQARRWKEAMAPIEPIRFVHLAPPAAILFQSARRDALVLPSDAEALHRAARAPKEVRWYDTGHGLDAPAIADMLAWFVERLGIEDRR